MNSIYVLLPLGGDPAFIIRPIWCPEYIVNLRAHRELAARLLDDDDDALVQQLLRDRAAVLRVQR